MNSGKDDAFLQDLYRLRTFYRLFRDFLDVHFSGYTMKTNDEINRQYLQLCTKIEKIIQSPSLSDFRKNWQPFEHLLDFDPDYPEGDWDYGGRKLCADYANKIEKIFVENGEKEYSIPGEDGVLLNKTRAFIKNYKESKKTSDDIFAKNAEKMGNDFQKKQSVSKPIPVKPKTKFSNYILYPILCWMAIGIVLAILNFGGVFLEPHAEEIDISKKYQVAYETWTDENTLTGIFEGMSLTGKITLESTQFTAQNKIDVNIELSPNTNSALEDIILLDSITPPLNVYFVGAQHVDIENEHVLADILLKRSSDRTKLIGDGSIIYSKGGSYDIYLLDSSEISLKQDLLTIHEPNGSIVLFLEQENTLNPNGYFDENGNPMKVPTRVEFFSENIPYVVDIKQSDALNSLSSDKRDAFTIWITLAFAPLALIPVLKHFKIFK